MYTSLKENKFKIQKNSWNGKCENNLRDEECNLQEQSDKVIIHRLTIDSNINKHFEDQSLESERINSLLTSNFKKQPAFFNNQ
jgi:hypothetical protein